MQREQCQKYFGAPLEDVVKEGGVPLLLKQCIEIVDERGLQMSGIYRLPGDRETCLHLQEKIDKGDDFVEVKFTESTQVANLLITSTKDLHFL